MDDEDKGTADSLDRAIAAMAEVLCRLYPGGDTEWHRVPLAKLIKALLIAGFDVEIRASGKHFTADRQGNLSFTNETDD